MSSRIAFGTQVGSGDILVKPLADKRYSPFSVWGPHVSLSLAPAIPGTPSVNAAVAIAATSDLFILPSPRRVIVVAGERTAATDFALVRWESVFPMACRRAGAGRGSR